MRIQRVFVASAALMLLAGGLRADSPPPKLEEAVAAQQRLIDADASNAELYNDLGNLLFLDGQTQAAEEAYEAGIRLDPELLSLRYNYALLLQQSNRLRRAEREYRKVLKNDDDNAWAHYQMGVLLSKRGRRSAAIQSYARSMQLEPRLTDPAFNPHILENSLASSAVLRAYGDLSAAVLAPRVYENPGAVASLLLAAQEGTSPAQGDPEDKKKAKKKRRAKKTADES